VGNLREPVVALRVLVIGAERREIEHEAKPIAQRVSNLVEAQSGPVFVSAPQEHRFAQARFGVGQNTCSATRIAAFATKPLHSGLFRI
jgi:hypothetical protein